MRKAPEPARLERRREAPAYLLEYARHEWDRVPVRPSAKPINGHFARGDRSKVADHHTRDEVVSVRTIMG